MKSLWKTILNGLTYADLAGHRQPRAYTVISTLIVLLLLAAGAMAGFNRHLLMSRVRATPMPVSLTTPLPQSVQPPTQAQGETVIHCPTNPADWSLTPTYASANYEVIQPACVYQGLERTIAWALAVREGYSRLEATHQLGFAQMPIRQMRTVTVPLDAKGLAQVPVGFIPPNPDLTEWRLNSQGQAAVTYALRGCFRTSTVVGNRLELWGGDYPVICLVVEDAENSHIVYALNDHIYTSSATPMRSFLLFGYLADGNWVWLGTKENPKLEITNPQANANERLTIATLYDSYPWDSDWLRNTYHLMALPPPPNWKAMTSEKEQQAILMDLAQGLQEGTP